MYYIGIQKNIINMNYIITNLTFQAKSLIIKNVMGPPDATATTVAQNCGISRVLMVRKVRRKYIIKLGA